MRHTTQNASKTRPRDLRYLADPIVAICVLLVIVGAGLFGLWAATAPLAQGVTAGGVLIVENRRLTVQHLEGGIIQQIHIREGATVKAGELAMVITDANAAARFSQASAERLRLQAEIDRYRAHLADADILEFRELDRIEGTADLQALNIALFEDQRAAQAGEKALVTARIDRLRAQAAALEVRRIGKRREIASLLDEQSVQNAALNERLGNISRVNELVRLLAIAETDLANLDEEERVIEQSIAESRLEFAQLDLTFRARMSEALAEASGELASVTEELTALSDRQARNRVVIPADGEIIDLAYTAAGGVIGPGDPLFDVVPSRASYQVEVRFQPRDRDELAEGRAVNLRFGTLDPINPPQISGTLDQIAPDASLDQQSGAFYYLASVSIDPAELSELDAFKISPGIPVEVFFDKGAPRTPLSYFIEPLSEMMRLGMRS